MISNQSFALAKTCDDVPIVSFKSFFIIGRFSVRQEGGRPAGKARVQSRSGQLGLLRTGGQSVERAATHCG